MKCTHQVLTGRQIHCRLAADGSVDLREQSRGHLNKRNPAQISRRRESGKVAHHATTKSDDTIISFQTRAAKETERLFQRAQRLMLLAVFHQPMTRFEV